MTNESPNSTIDTLIMVVEDDYATRVVITTALEMVQYQVQSAADPQIALKLLDETTPHLIVSDLMMPHMDGLEFLQVIRSTPKTRHIPFILLTAVEEDESIIRGMDLGADDYLIKPVDLPVLLARIRAKLRRPPVPIDEVVRDYRTSAFTFDAFMHELSRELARIKEWNTAGCLAVVGFHEIENLRHRIGDVFEPIVRQVSTLIQFDGSSVELVGVDGEEHLLLLLPEVTTNQAQLRLEHLAKRIAGHDFTASKELIRLTPVIGYIELDPDKTPERHHLQALDAFAQSELQLDLLPKLYTVNMPPTREMQIVSSWNWLPRLEFFRLNQQALFQAGLTFVIGWGIPFLIYTLAGELGQDVTRIAYLTVVITLVITAILIWIEGYLSLKEEPLPEVTTDYPPASMIIPAYLPNEAATILSTIQVALQVDYPAPLQIILAFNTPRHMPIIETLERLALEHENFMLLNVEDSTSKAQNVNAALSYVTGEFVGLFDADHQPDPDCFRRAWAWLSNGYDVVQGHCLVRNGNVSWISQIIAVEFESIYAVSHPGRARLHGFGIFGGSNGYWRTALLRQIRMRKFMLTEDIDSTMRAVLDGYNIKSDRNIISRELAPTTLNTLWTQRMRWAQGWYQVTLRHGMSGLLSHKLSLQQKLGFFQLLIWREVYPWIAMQIIPIIVYWLLSRDGLSTIDWFVPIFVVTTLFTLGTGPGQIFFLLRVGNDDILQNRKWVVLYLLSGLFYVEYKNMISRVAQVREILGERIWQTTPRN